MYLPKSQFLKNAFDTNSICQIVEFALKPQIKNQHLNGQINKHYLYMAYIYFAFDVLVQLLCLSRVFKNTSFERLNAKRKRLHFNLFILSGCYN